MILSSGEDLIFFWVVVIVRPDHLELMGGLSWFKAVSDFVKAGLGLVCLYI